MSRITYNLQSHLASNLSVNVPDDFLELAAAAMQHLKSCGRANVVYNLAKAIGTMREDLSDSLLPAKRMPIGLIEHCVNFFCSTRQQVCRFAYTCIICTLFRYFSWWSPIFVHVFFFFDKHNVYIMHHVGSMSR